MRRRRRRRNVTRPRIVAWPAKTYRITARKQQFLARRRFWRRALSRVLAFRGKATDSAVFNFGVVKGSPIGRGGLFGPDHHSFRAVVLPLSRNSARSHRCLRSSAAATPELGLRKDAGSPLGESLSDVVARPEWSSASFVSSSRTANRPQRKRKSKRIFDVPARDQFEATLVCGRVRSSAGVADFDRGECTEVAVNRGIGSGEGRSNLPQALPDGRGTLCRPNRIGGG